MLRLMLLRHGKSAWPAGVRDYERPLAARGRAASPWVGSYMAAEALVPDLALVSTARRARETWELARLGFEEQVRDRDEPQLYEASAAAILAIVRRLGSEVSTLLLVGHNPGLQDFALTLTGHAEASDLARLRRKLPTASLVVIDFPARSWSDVGPQSGRLARFIVPPTMPASKD